MPSFVPKEPDIDLAYRPGTIQYLRRLEKEKLEHMAKIEPVDNPPLSVDKELLISEKTDSKIAGHGIIAGQVINEGPANIAPQVILDGDAKDNGHVNIAPVAINQGPSNITPHANIASDAELARHVINAAPVIFDAPVNFTPHADIALVSANSPSQHASEDSVEDNLSALFSAPHANIAPAAKFDGHASFEGDANNAAPANSAPHALKQWDANIPRHVKLTRHAISSEEALPVQIMQNYSRRDKEVANLMQHLTANEWKVYCYFLSITHELWVPELRAGTTHCWTTHPVIQNKTGIASNNTVGKVVESLEARGLIKRTYTARRSLEKSQYRVFLPFELVGYQGKTILKYEKGVGGPSDVQ